MWTRISSRNILLTPSPRQPSPVPEMTENNSPFSRLDHGYGGKLEGPLHPLLPLLPFLSWSHSMLKGESCPMVEAIIHSRRENGLKSPLFCAWHRTGALSTSQLHCFSHPPCLLTKAIKFRSQHQTGREGPHPYRRFPNPFTTSLSPRAAGPMDQPCLSFFLRPWDFAETSSRLIWQMTFWV